ncbi:GtrA family protein [Bordetella petrii]|uniref:GtrA family protein n=1 Tax=Bordetella petrii TaxID=94624 RepID=A0ABT7W8P4_9BORD|nr:GtrA family protein [Bordetella petrii]MDM9561568.1 GtrA family protein [Bordetella petrii]
MRALIKQIGWFLCVGCAAAATHWAVAVGCVEQLGLPPLAANAIGWLVAFVVSFTGHYRLTFRHLASHWTVAARRFFLISACGFLLNEAAYAWLLHTTRVRYDALLALILLGLAALTFLASRLWAFRRRPGA